MFETEIDPPPERSRKYTRKDYAVWLAGMFAVSIGYALWLGYSSWADARIALRERTSVGVITSVKTWGRGPANHYRFSFAGITYDGASGAYPLVVGKSVTIYLDPDDPSTNNVTDYQIESKREHSFMMTLIYVSIGWAFVLVFVVRGLPASEPSESEGSDDQLS